MFYLLLVVGIIVIVCGVALMTAKFKASVPSGAAVILLGLGLVVYSFTTAQGEMIVMKLFASNSRGNWLVIDNSGGETMRHWVLQDAYVQSSEQSDGWQFYDDEGNLCYVSGDAYVQRINMDFDEFLTNYKEIYNIPADQRSVNFQLSKKHAAVKFHPDNVVMRP